MDFVNEPKNLNVSLNQNISELKLKTTYFFRRVLDNEIIPIEEPQAAWNYYTTRNSEFKYIGKTDGKAFQEALKEARILFKEKGLQASQERIRQAIKDEGELAKQNTTPPQNADIFGNGAHLIANRLKKYA